MAPKAEKAPAAKGEKAPAKKTLSKDGKKAKKAVKVTRPGWEAAPACVCGCVRVCVGCARTRHL